MISIDVLKAGLLTTIQDEGRTGYQHLGVPPGGALDRAAARRANALVGNARNTPVLEITLHGPRLRFATKAMIAITGAALSPQLDGRAIPDEHLIAVKPEEVLAFGRCEGGCRAYLAIRGQWQVDQWLGSASCAIATTASTTPKARLKRGDRLRIAPLPEQLKPSCELPEYAAEAQASRRKEETTDLWVTPAPEWSLMSSRWKAAFFLHRFSVSRATDRMGCRLVERLRVPEGMGQMLSSGVLPGTVQLTPAGQLIILQADAQTTGGYYRIAQLQPAALDALAQLKAGDKLHFRRDREV